VILHHATPFGYTERQARSVARAESARQRLLGWHHPGVVLTGPAAVAWATGGIAPPVDRTASTDLVWAVITAERCALITTNVEADRVRDEYDPVRHGFAELIEVPWHEPDAFTRAAVELAGLPPSQLASDGHRDFGIDASAELISLRLALSAAEVDDLADLAADATHALQIALKEWRPGERDFDIQARCAALLESAGADAPVLIVGGDDRLAAYRHPMAVGAPVRQLVMAVTVARRAGLHVALTRFAAAGSLPPGYRSLRDRVLAIEAAVLRACTPGATYGNALDALAAGYAAAGAPDGWTGHYQGGPIGYAQREFEIAPGQEDSQWYRQPLAAGQAIAWNPSLPGGAKVEDTYLMTAAGQLSRLTDAPDWPSDHGRPAVLEVGS
jgi:Xaa-Pro dipeptidase